MSDTPIIDHWATKVPKEYRDAVIEECARVAEDRRWGVHTPLETIAAAIRALKDRP